MLDLSEEILAMDMLLLNWDLGRLRQEFFRVDRFVSGAFWMWDGCDIWDRICCCLWSDRRVCRLLRCRSGKWFSDGGEEEDEQGGCSASLLFQV